MQASVSGKAIWTNTALLLLLGAVVFSIAGSAWASEAGGHGGEHGLNWTDFAYRTVAFVVLFAILFKLLKNPISNFLSSRRDEIQRMLNELEANTKEAEKRNFELKARLASVEEEAKKIVDELISEGEQERQRIIEAAHKQADYIKQQALVAVQQEVEGAKNSLKKEFAELSVAAAEELLKKKMKADDQKRLVREFVTMVEAK